MNHEINLMENLEAGNDRLAHELRIETDPMLKNFAKDRRAYWRDIAAGIIGLTVASNSSWRLFKRPW